MRVTQKERNIEKCDEKKFRMNGTPTFMSRPRFFVMLFTCAYIVAFITPYEATEIVRKKLLC